MNAEHRHDWKELTFDEAVAEICKQNGSRSDEELARVRATVASALGFNPRQKRFSCACGAMKFDGGAP